LYFPQIDGQTVQPVPQALLEALPDDVRLVDLTPELRSYTSRAPLQTLVLPNDGHPNPTMYELFAHAAEPVVADALAAARGRPSL
jgi:lysophospholipase L1-like esterase